MSLRRELGRRQDMSAPFSTIVLIHDLWLTPLSWEPFHNFYANLGYQVFAPAWPGIEGSVADMHRDPSALNGIGAGELVARYAKIVRSLSESPVIMGHGYGGMITQLLLDQGLGGAGVAISSFPPKGVLMWPLSTWVSLLPALRSFFNQHGTCRLNLPQFRRAFGNTLPASEARRIYEAQAIPAPCRSIFQAALANLTTHTATVVDFKNSRRPPLLFIGGGKDAIVPPSLGRRIVRKHRASPCHAGYKEFPGRSHYIIAEQGWQEVADYALTWALTHARALR